MQNNNPFSDVPVATTPRETQTALMDVAAQREVAEVQAAVILAKKFPRNQIEAMDRILVACQRPGLAEGALYTYARGGTEISGPSIRLAEAIAQNWQNIQFGIRELDQRNGESTVESYAWDLETNTRQTKVFQVKHERYTKKAGNYRLEDPRDIYEQIANQGARRLRACILGIIPGDVVEAATAQCEVTMKSKADTSPEAMKKMVEAFGQYGVTKLQIEKRIQRKIDSITAAQLIALRKIFNSLKDGMSTPVDWFEVVQSPDDSQKQTGTDAIKSKLRGRPPKQADPPPIPPESQASQESEMPEFSDSQTMVECPKTGEPTRVDFCGSECGERVGCPAFPAED
jgi:hypothetical protein